MPGRAHHTAKFNRCVDGVMKDGDHDKNSAYAICTASFQKAGVPIYDGDKMRAAEGATVRIVALAGASGKSRTAKHDGRDHLVVPVVALVEGVIHPVNAPTRELVRAELFGRTLSSWNGRPLFAGHPLRNGSPVSGNTPEVLDTCLGRVFNPRVEGKRLLMEAWLDPTRCAAHAEGQRLLERAKANEMIEVSVGVFVDAVPATGEFNGRAYSAEWASMTPDHLALLNEGQVGACSTAMGCGVRAAQSAEDVGADDWRFAGEGPGHKFHGNQYSNRDTSGVGKPSEKTPQELEMAREGKRRREQQGGAPEGVTVTRKWVSPITERITATGPGGLKASIQQTVHGNWYGYVGGKRTQMFMGYENDEASATKWMYAHVTKPKAEMTPEERAKVRKHKQDARAKGMLRMRREAGGEVGRKQREKDWALQQGRNHQKIVRAIRKRQDPTIALGLVGDDEDIDFLVVEEFRAMGEGPGHKFHGNQYDDKGKGQARNMDYGLESHESVESWKPFTDLGKTWQRISVESQFKYGVGVKRSRALLRKKAVLGKKGWDVNEGSRGRSKVTTFHSPVGYTTEQADAEFRAAGDKPGHDFHGNQYGDAHASMLKTIKANEDPYEAQDKLETQFAEHDDDTLKGVRSKASEALDAHEEGTHEYKAAIHVRAAANNVLQKRLKGTPEQQAQRRKEALAAESAAMDFLKKLKPGRRRRNAEQSEEPELRAACGCGGTCHECTHDHAANAAEGTEMERKQRIAALAANPHSTVRSIAVLDELTDEELDQAEAAVVEAKKVADKAAADGDALKTAEGRIKALETAAETLKTEEGFLAAAPQSIRDVVADSKATAKAKVDGLVETLKTAQTAYSEEELRAKPVAELEKLTTLLKVEAPVVDYSGRGTPRFASQKDSKTEFAPPDPYAEGIKALQGK